MLEVHKSHLAEADLIGIWRYSSGNWGERQADLYLDQIEGVLFRLREDPMMGTDCSEIKQGYWKIRSGKHLIFYRVDGDLLVVIRVLHGMMDIESHL